MALEAAKGLLHLHSEGVIHRCQPSCCIVLQLAERPVAISLARDVAARNYLVDEHLHVRVADFGFARLKETSRNR
jgi:serine/threonine protein kinase